VRVTVNNSTVAMKAGDLIYVLLCSCNRLTAFSVVCVIFSSLLFIRQTLYWCRFLQFLITSAL
jgi:hypothetical protein